MGYTLQCLPDLCDTFSSVETNLDIMMMECVCVGAGGKFEVGIW